MGKSVKQKDADTLKDVALSSVNNLNYSINKEAMLFIEIISELVENKIYIRDKSMHGWERQHGFHFDSRKHEIERLKSTINALRMQDVKDSPLLNSSIKRLEFLENEKKYKDTDKEAKYYFVSILLKNVDNGVITSNSIYLTMKSLCPLWPFC
jgi:hypothetical protein